MNKKIEKNKEDLKEEKVVNGEAGISEINSEISGLIDTIKG